MSIKVFVHGLVVRMFENEMCGGRVLRIAVGITLLTTLLLEGASAATVPCNYKFPDPKSLQVETHEGDLLLSGNNSLLIENKTFIVNGNIYLSGNARLTLRNSTIEVKHYPRQEIFITDHGIIDADNVTFQGFIHSSFQGQSMLVMNRVFFINLIYVGDQAQGNIRNSCIFQENVGLVQVGEQAKMQIENSTVGAIGFFIPAQYNISIDNLLPGYFEYWSAKKNISSSLSFDIVLNNTDIKDNPGYSGGFEMGWNIFVPSEINMSISNSVLNKLVVFFYDENVQMSNLIRRKPVDFNIRSIHLQNTTVQGQWGIFVTRGETLIENSDGVWLWPVGTNNTIVTNTSINEFDPRQYTGKVILSNASMTDGFEIFDNSIFRMEGSVRMLAIGPVFTSDSRMTRNYEVRLIDGRYNTPLSNISLLLAKNGIPFWNGTTDTGGSASFDITFDANNYQDRWLLSSTNTTIFLNKAIYINSSTPVAITMEPVQENRLWSVIYVDCQRSDTGDGTKNSPYASIQKGIDSAAGGGLVRVATGTCWENVTLKDDIILMGAGADNTTIEGDVFAWNVNNVQMRDFTITDTSTAGIHSYNSSLTITNNIIRNQPHNGIYGFNSSLTILNNILIYNGHNGIFLIYSSEAVIKNNIFANNGQYGVSGDGTSSATIDYNVVWHNNISDYGAGFSAGTHDLYVDPLFIDVNSNNFRLQSSSPAIDAGDPDSVYNDADGSRNDIGVFGGPSFSQTPAPTPTPTANVSISGFSFQPQTINVTAGTTVTWTNMDSVLHTVTSDTGLFDSGSLSTGQTFSRTFNTAGNYDYHCSIHPSMIGRVAVSSAAVTPTPTPSPTPTPTPSPGGNVVSRYAGSDGIVQRSEAVQAVMDYFAGTITKQEAIEVVMAYFTG